MPFRLTVACVSVVRLCPGSVMSPTERPAMLAALLLVTATQTATQQHAVSTSQHISATPHQLHEQRLHLLHVRHLAHERHVRLERLRHVRPSRAVVTAKYSGHTALPGHLSCRGLESLWESAGGNSGSAFLAAEIAMAESGGNQYATGPAGERGYWQIHPDHGALSTYDPYGNARAAVIISDNGRNWSPWTTYTHGLYAGKC
jgi:lysozyme-like protein